MTRIEHLESRIDALEEAIQELTGRKVEPSDREYMRLFLRGDKEGAKAMLRELDRRGGMPQRSETVCLTGDDPSRTAAARGVSCSSAPVTDSLGPRPGHTY